MGIGHEQAVQAERTAIPAGGSRLINGVAYPAGVVPDSGKWKMAGILADYREWRQQQEARVSTHSDGCHMWHRDCMIHRLADALAVEQAKRTLTDAERFVLREVMDIYAGEDDVASNEIAAVIDGLLERTK
jgi:hypothetical protein